MNEARRKGLEEGKKLGEKIGEKNGKKEKTVEIAKKLLEKNIDIEIIIETTGITKEELETLKNGQVLFKIIDKRLVVYSSKLVSGDIKVAEEYLDAKNTIVICITTDNILKRNAYLSVAKLKFEETQKKRYANMGYEKEDEYLTDMVSYYIIELTKLKENKPRTADLLEKWLLIIGGDAEMMERCRKEEGEIKEAIEQLEEMSADEKEREIYEIRERKTNL